MTKEQAIEELKIQQKNKDIEIAHGKADYILCKLLIELGFKEVIVEYKKVNKWYA